MNTPNSEQAIRIRLYGLWLNQFMNWWLFSCFMKINKNYEQTRERFPLTRLPDGQEIRGNDVFFLFVIPIRTRRDYGKSYQRQERNSLIAINKVKREWYNKFIESFPHAFREDRVKDKNKLLYYFDGNENVT